MRKNIEKKVVVVTREEFESALVEKLSQAKKEYSAIYELVERYQLDKENYNIKYLYDGTSYSYTKSDKRIRGFGK